MTEIKFNPKVKTYLDRLAGSVKRPSSYLFVGADEIEKGQAAFYFISKIAGKSKDADFLKKAQSKNHPDIVVIEPEIEEKKGKIREKEITIGQSREALERLKFFPYELKKKFCVVKKAEKLNSEAANALLKTLEEPTENAIFLLLASDSDSVLPTILSRCAVLRFPQTNLSSWNEENRSKLKNIFKEELFEKFNYIEAASKNKNNFLEVLKDWEMVAAESLRKLITDQGDTRARVRKVVELIGNNREAINRLEFTNAGARVTGERLVLEMK